MNIPFTKFKILYLLLASVIATSCAEQSTRPASTDIQDSSSLSQAVSGSDRELYRDAITALNNKDFSTAQSLLNEFIRKKPMLAGGYTNLALLHLKKQEHDDSLKMVNKAIELNPKQAQAYNLRGQINVSLGKIHDAKDDYLKSVELKPSYTNAQYNLALLYDIYLQDLSLAIKHYEIYMSLLKTPDEATKEWINHLKGTLSNG